MRNGRGYKWTVGITTCPRPKGYYLDQTVDSLHDAGWDAITIFAEPDSAPISTNNMIYRPFQYGDWTNWATGFYELLLSHPDTDYFLMSEDDAVYKSNTKKYLERAIPYLGDFASLSLYTPLKYHKANFSGFHDECHDWETLSTVSVVMSREKAVLFFASDMVQKHRFENILADVGKINYGCKCDPKNSIKDAVIGRWANRLGLPIYYHTPSFVQHIGEDSTIASVAVEKKNLQCSETYACWEQYAVRTNRSGSISLL